MSLLVCLLLSLTPTANRPPQATKGAEVARVIAGKAGVTVVDAKQFSFVATPQTPLLETDSVQVPVDGFVLLELSANGYVVRIDEDLTLAVRDIALLKAPKTKLSAQAQLEKLLTPDERQGLPQRLTGWYASPTAANVPSVRSEPVAQKAAATQSQRRQLGGLEGKVNEAEKDKKADAPGDDRLQDELRPKRGSGGAREAPSAAFGVGGGGKAVGSASTAPPGTAPAASVASVQQPPAEQPIAAPAPAPAPAPPVVLAANAELRACVVKDVPAKVLKALGKTLVIRYRVDAKGAVRVVLSNAMPTPDCASAWFLSHAAQLSTAPGWHTLEVPLQ